MTNIIIIKNGERTRGGLVTQQHTHHLRDNVGLV